MYLGFELGHRVSRWADSGFSFSPYSEKKGGKYPGMHIHVDTNLMESDARSLLRETGKVLPELIAFTGNPIEEGRHNRILSNRQSDQYGGGTKTKGSVRYRPKFQTIEYRMPDIEFDPLQQTAQAAFLTGLQTSLENIVENDSESLFIHDYCLETDSADYVLPDERCMAEMRNGSIDLEIPEILNLSVEGMKEIGYPNTDVYIDLIEARIDYMGLQR